MIPRSIEPTALSPRTIRWESCRRDQENQGTRPRSKPASDLLRPTFWEGCARRRSSRSPNATRPSRDVLGALPAEDWEFAEWRRARVNLDYHIEVHDFLYSVPHTLIRAEVEVRVTARVVEVFHRGQRVAAHQRRYIGRRHGTDPEHMPSSHRRYAEWTPDRFRRWACKIGPNTEGLIGAVLASRRHPEQGFRTCLGILRSFRGLDTVRLEAVSARALELGVLNCKGVAALLARKPDDAPAQTDHPIALLDHANLRGPGYYH
jgi:transposase